MSKNLALIGAGIGIGAADGRSVDAPEYFRRSSYLKLLDQHSINYHWHKMIHEDINNPALESIHQFNLELAQTSNELTKNNQKFCVIGGDHSCAIGTWSGVSESIDEDIGLIWIDAHMDAHTTETTLTGNIHGMPVATLLGYGHDRLTHIMSKYPKLKPENIVLVGIRSFEKEEKELLDTLGVTVYSNNDVFEQGIQTIIDKAFKQIQKTCNKFGFSIDLDGLDPKFAPGTGTPVDQGIDGDELCQSLCQFADNKDFLGFEVVEFNPHLDQNHITELTMVKLILALTAGETLNESNYTD